MSHFIQASPSGKQRSLTIPPSQSKRIGLRLPNSSILPQLQDKRFSRQVLGELALSNQPAQKAQVRRVRVARRVILVVWLIAPAQLAKAINLSLAEACLTKCQAISPF